ncbi:MAG TPA: STAS domain-containing protein [Thermoanaerobaculia bacterium]
MKLQKETKGAHAILRITGTLSLGDSTRMLQEQFEQIAEDLTGAIILDLSGLEHLDSTAVGVLVGGLKRFEAKGRRFFLVNPRERVMSVFRITHLDSVFRVFPSIDGALALADIQKDEETGGR